LARGAICRIDARTGDSCSSSRRRRRRCREHADAIASGDLNETPASDDPRERRRLADRRLLRIARAKRERPALPLVPVLVVDQSPSPALADIIIGARRAHRGEDLLRVYPLQM
jgi:hypothetical protein